MTDPGEPPPRHPARNRGTHAAPPTPARLLVRSLFAVAVVGVVVALLLVWRGSPTTSTADSGPGPAVVRTPPSPGESTTPSPTEVISPTSGPTVAAPTPNPRPTRVVAPLFVANNTREQGKAHRAATKFQKGGWPISGTGNYRGRQLAETTVYYTPGNDRERAAAESLHQQFPQVKGVAPRFAGLPGHGLVVVLTAAFPA